MQRRNCLQSDTYTHSHTRRRPPPPPPHGAQSTPTIIIIFSTHTHNAPTIYLYIVKREKKTKNIFFKQQNLTKNVSCSPAKDNHFLSLQQPTQKKNKQENSLCIIVRNTFSTNMKPYFRDLPEEKRNSSTLWSVRESQRDPC